MFMWQRVLDCQSGVINAFIDSSSMEAISSY